MNKWNKLKRKEEKKRNKTYTKSVMCCVEKELKTGLFLKLYIRSHDLI